MHIECSGTFGLDPSRSRLSVINQLPIKIWSTVTSSDRLGGLHIGALFLTLRGSSLHV